MGKQLISFEFEVLDGQNLLEEDDFTLMNHAKGALEQAYAPYSKFKVGAALVDSEGNIFKGANMENAAYPMCICAEGALLTAFNTSGSEATVLTVAITAHADSHVLNHPVAPCGACRQMLSELEIKQNHPIRLILMGEQGKVYIIDRIKDVLPIQFTSSEL
ncbi:MAG: cytidine deaminase [Saprospiraceae bacterium]|nr:cytidine deaminase [Saprospiraceae bacterium]